MILIFVFFESDWNRSLIAVNFLVTPFDFDIYKKSNNPILKFPAITSQPPEQVHSKRALNEEIKSRKGNSRTHQDITQKKDILMNFNKGKTLIFILQDG